MHGIKRKIAITLASCLAIFLLTLLIIKSNKNIVSFQFYGQNDYWEVKTVYTINQDLKTITRSCTLISKIEQPDLAHLDITVSDNNRWISTDSMELSKGMVKGEKKINTSGTNYNQNKMKIDSIKVDILLNNSVKQNILLKKVE